MSRLKQKLDASKDGIGKTVLWQLFLAWRCFGMGQTSKQEGSLSPQQKAICDSPWEGKSIWALKNTINITPGSWIPWVWNAQQLGGHVKRTLCPSVVAKYVQGPRQHSFALPHLPRMWHWLHLPHSRVKLYLKSSGQSEKPENPSVSENMKLVWCK